MSLNHGDAGLLRRFAAAHACADADSSELYRAGIRRS